MQELLSEDEHKFLDLLAEASRIGHKIAAPPKELLATQTYGGDWPEMVTLIHQLQNMVLAQAAARAYPDKYRLMGHSWR